MFRNHVYLFLMLWCAFGLAEEKMKSEGPKKRESHAASSGRRLRDEASLKGMEKAANDLLKKNRQSFEDIKMSNEELQKLLRELSTQQVTKPMSCAEQTMLPNDFDKFFSFPSMFLGFTNFDEGPNNEVKRYKEQAPKIGNAGIVITGEPNTNRSFKFIPGDHTFSVDTYFDMDTENSKAFQRITQMRRKQAADDVGAMSFQRLYHWGEDQRRFYLFRKQAARTWVPSERNWSRHISSRSFCKTRSERKARG